MENPTPYVYTDIYEAPEAWRRLNNAVLSVSQLNEITAGAYELGAWVEAVSGEPPVFHPNYAQARARFKASYTVVDNHWVVKNPA